LESIAKSGLTVAGPSGSREFRWEAIQLFPGDQLITQTPKTISDGTQTFCVANQLQKDYCAYDPRSLVTIVSVEEGCRPGALHIPPTECFNMVKGEPVVVFVQIISHSLSFIKNIMYSKHIIILVRSGLRSCDENDATSTSDLTDGVSRPKRLFKPFVNATPYGDDSDKFQDDEDYYKDDGRNKSSIAILNEIWNFYDRQTDILLGFRDKEYEYHYETPIFQILQLSLEIMKKTCPPHYVPPGFLSMCVNSFIQLIRKQKFYTEFAYDFDGIERTKEALLKCTNNMTFFPFTHFQNDSCNGTVSRIHFVKFI